LLTLSVFLQVPDFSGAVTPSGWQSWSHFAAHGAARRNGSGIWRHRPVGFPAPEEAGWITGYAINANGGHVRP